MITPLAIIGFGLRLSYWCLGFPLRLIKDKVCGIKTDFARWEWLRLPLLTLSLFPNWYMYLGNKKSIFNYD
jgi:hypothetical protein